MYLQLASMLRNQPEHCGYFGIEQRVALAIELHGDKKWEKGLRHRLDRLKAHVTPSGLGLVEIFLAAADLTSEIAFVGQSQIGGDRRRNRAAAALPIVIAARMEAP